MNPEQMAELEVAKHGKNTSKPATAGSKASAKAAS
jgi:hypothetical protein